MSDLPSKNQLKANIDSQLAEWGLGYHGRIKTEEARRYINRNRKWFEERRNGDAPVHPCFRENVSVFYTPLMLAFIAVYKERALEMAKLWADYEDDDPAMKVPTPRPVSGAPALQPARKENNWEVDPATKEIRPPSNQIRKSG